MYVSSELTLNTKAKRRLTPKQMRFVDYYMLMGNAKKAALAAGYSPKMKNCLGQKVRNSPAVTEAIEKRQREWAERLQITPDNVLGELAKIAFTRLDDVVEVDGGVVRVKAMDEGNEVAKAAIQEISMTRQGLKVKMHDKVGALNKLGDHLGLFEHVKVVAHRTFSPDMDSVSNPRRNDGTIIDVESSEVKELPDGTDQVSET